MSSAVTNLQVTRHSMEQWAYEEVRFVLSQQFITNPVSFMHMYGKRPEDLVGKDLRDYYRNAVGHGLVARGPVSYHTKQKFETGGFFAELPL